MASSANTFGTYLKTVKQLRSARSAPPDALGDDRIGKEMIRLADLISRAGGHVSVKDALDMMGLDRETFLVIVEEAVRRNLVSQTETDGNAVLELSSLGKAFAMT
jgi:hypothetical protein